MVTKLVDRGLMSRRRPRSDRRMALLTLTEEGMALTSELDRRVRAFDARLAEGVSEEEMATFVAVSSKAMTNYAALAQAAQS